MVLRLRVEPPGGAPGVCMEETERRSAREVHLQRGPVLKVRKGVSCLHSYGSINSVDPGRPLRQSFLMGRK
jgi:hypothetical protein